MRWSGVAVAPEHVALAAAFGKPLVDWDRLFIWRHFGAVHGATHGHGERDEVLHLLRAPVVFREVGIHHAHVALGAAWEIRDEVRDHELLFSRRGVHAVENVLELIEYARLPFPHQAQDLAVEVFRGNAELAADVVADDLFCQARLDQREVEADAGVDEDVLHAGDAFDAVEQVHERLLVRVVVRADRGEQTRNPSAFSAFFGVEGPMTVDIPLMHRWALLPN